MAKFTDYEVNNEVSEIMEKIIEALPKVFEGFDVNAVQPVMTKGKKSKRGTRLIPVKYPYDILIDKVYFVEVFEQTWKNFSPKQKHLSVFHQMCSIPSGGFDPESNNYAKKRKPDYEMFAEEFAVTNGVPNWLENDDARDVFEAAEQAKKTGQDILGPIKQAQAAKTKVQTTPASTANATPSTKSKAPKQATTAAATIAAATAATPAPKTA
jgi:predicted metallopeptidase